MLGRYLVNLYVKIIIKLNHIVYYRRKKWNYLFLEKYDKLKEIKQLCIINTKNKMNGEMAKLVKDLAQWLVEKVW